MKGPKLIIEKLRHLKIVEKIKSVCSFFGFVTFPQELKISIQFVNRDEFERIFLENSNEVSASKSVAAITVDCNKIYVVDSHCTNEKIESYSSIIVHERVHVAQMYYSKIKTSSCIWLYETMAVFLSGQKPLTNDFPKPTWETFTSNFYSHKYCYGAAYLFAKKLFDNYPKEQILSAIKYPTANFDWFKNIYITTIQALEETARLVKS